MTGNKIVQILLLPYFILVRGNDQQEKFYFVYLAVELLSDNCCHARLCDNNDAQL
jgi:hypothetical protein